MVSSVFDHALIDSQVLAWLIQFLAFFQNGLNEIIDFKESVLIYIFLPYIVKADDLAKRGVSVVIQNRLRKGIIH